MKYLLLLPLIGAALLFSGCEATVVDGRPHRGYGYGERSYVGVDRGRDYRYRSDDSYHRRSNSSYRQGYVSTRPVYVAPVRTSHYQRNREIRRTQVVTPRAPVQVTVIKGGQSGHKKGHKKNDDRDHR